MKWSQIQVPVAWSDGSAVRGLNPAATRLLGGEERPCEEVFADADHAAWERLVRRVRASNLAITSTLSVRGMDGTPRAMRVGAAIGDDTHLVLTLQERIGASPEQAEDQSSSAFFRTLLDQTPTIFFVVDQDGRLVFRNSAFDRLAGEVIHMVSLASLPQLTHAFHDELAEAFEDGQVRQFQVRRTHPDGTEQSIQVDIEPLRGPRGEVRQALVVGVDLTELLQAHAEQRSLQGQLAEARRLEALGQMAGTIAHDFNNFLSVMLMSAGLLRESLPDASEDVEAGIDAIEQVSKQAQALTQDLVAFSRAQVHSVRSSRLDGVIAAIQAALPRLVPPTIAFNLTIPESLPEPSLFVPLSESQCLQIAVNLVQNAVEATGGIGRIDVELERKDQAVWIRVSDDGPGVPPEVAARIFEPFYTTRAGSGGTGLGLSSARTLVERAGGALEVSTGPMGGACFSVMLPLMTG